MSKNKNPAYSFENPQAWILAGECFNRKLMYSEVDSLARERLGMKSHLVHVALRELQYRSATGRQSRLLQRIASRLPNRPTLRSVPFFLRAKYYKPEATTSYIPERAYTSTCLSSTKDYRPILDMKTVLHKKRIAKLKIGLEGLVRWTYDINGPTSEITVCRSFDDFRLKISTGKEPNNLPTSHTSISLSVVAPLEFLNQSFFGFGEHLVVKVLEPEYQLPDGTRVIRTLSCDRSNLYDLQQPNVLKERFYVFGSHKSGTGLTLQAAIKSMEYFTSKDITSALGA